MSLPIKKQNAEERAIVLRALELKELLGYKTDSDFVREQLTGLSSGPWSKLQKDRFDGNLENALTKLRQANNRMEARLSKQNAEARITATLSGDYYMLPLFTGIDSAVQTAMAEHGQNRLVPCALPTGGGKTATCNYLRKQYGAKVIHAALPSYRKSCMPLYKDIARALGLPVPNTKTRAEITVFDALHKNDGGLLAIDEGNNFGRESIDVLKAILNTTHWSVAFFSTPQHFNNMMNWYWESADQFLRRSVCIIEMPVLQPSDVAPFLNLESGQKEACKILAEAANEFGHFDLCHRVARIVATKGPANAEGVQTAVTTVRQILRTTRFAKNTKAIAKRGRAA